MFGIFRKDEGIVLCAVAKGEAVGLEEVNDPTFQEKMLGEGLAIRPSDGKFYSPADGEVSLVFDTLHALSVTSNEGVEILIHVGLDTVKRKGEGFTVHVSAGDLVKKGDLLMTADLAAIAADGYDTITPVVICNTGDYAAVKPVAHGEVNPGDDMIRIKK